MRFFADQYKQQHETSKWNTEEFNVDTLEGLELASMLDTDNEWNLDNPDFSQTASKKSSPVVASDTYTSLYQDTDSVSTFRPAASDEPSCAQPPLSFTPKVVSSIPTVSVTPSDSISRMSDVDSRMLSLEERFNMFNLDIQKWKAQAQQESNEQSKSLKTIIGMLLTGQGGIYPAQPQGHINVTPGKANHPTKMPSAGERDCWPWFLILGACLQFYWQLKIRGKTRIGVVNCMVII
jgi:hypothetical protein